MFYNISYGCAPDGDGYCQPPNVAESLILVVTEGEIWFPNWLSDTVPLNPK